MFRLRTLVRIYNFTFTSLQRSYVVRGAERPFFCQEECALYMSYLMRIGEGRNDIEFSGSNSTKGNYLIRSGNGRADINFENISTGGISYNLLYRYNTKLNDISWYPVLFSFFSLSNYPLRSDTVGSNQYNSSFAIGYPLRKSYKLFSTLKDEQSYSVEHVVETTYGLSDVYFEFQFSSNSVASSFLMGVKSAFNRLYIKMTIDGEEYYFENTIGTVDGYNVRFSGINDVYDAITSSSIINIYEVGFLAK